jgi:hypothetical protein
MSSNPLFPCPRCGSAALISHECWQGFYVLCTRCGLRTNDHKYTADAVSQWNWRPLMKASGSGGGSVRPARPRGVDGEAKQG